jgi:isocitrate lyase
VTLSGFHVLNYSMFALAQEYKKRRMAAYAELLAQEFAEEGKGYEATKHQEFVGAGYFDDVTQVATEGLASTLAMVGSTEREQF